MTNPYFFKSILPGHGSQIFSFFEPSSVYLCKFVFFAHFMKSVGQER